MQLKAKHYSTLDSLRIPMQCAPVWMMLRLFLVVFARVAPTLQILATAAFIDRALGVLSAAGSKLTQALKERNITVGSLTFNKITEPFGLTSPEPYTQPPKKESAKRFAFDMRV